MILIEDKIFQNKIIFIFVIQKYGIVAEPAVAPTPSTAVRIRSIPHEREARIFTGFFYICARIKFL